MKRLLLALAVSLTSGCIYLTPPTGLRIGDHANEFANAPTGQLTSGTVQFDKYNAPDFVIPFPAAWSLGRTEVSSGGKSTMRMSAGQRATSGEAEGVIVTTLDDPIDADPAKAKAGLAELVKSSLSQSYTAFKVVAEVSATLGGLDAVEIEATGKDPTGFDNHFLVRAAMRGGKGYIVVVSTLDSRFADYRPLFEDMLKNFAFKEGTAVSPAPSIAPSPEPSATPAGTGSPSPTPSP